MQLPGATPCGHGDSQVMAGTATEPQASFDSLPLEVARQIFTLLQPCDAKHARLVARSWLREVSAAVTTAKPTEPKLKKLRVKFPALRFLDLCKVNVTLQVVPFLGQMTQLTALSLKRNRGINDDALAELTPLLSSLRALSLARCFQVTDAGLQTVVEQLPRLVMLNLKCVYRLSDVALAQVAALTALEVLNMSKCRKACNTAVEAAASLPQLQALKISECPLITDAGLAAVGRARGLTLLHCKLDHNMEAQHTDAGWSALLPPLAHLRALHLSFEQAVGDATLAAVARITALEDLHIDRAYAVTDAGVAQLAALSRLSSLQLHETRQLTDGGLVSLVALADLLALTLTDQQGITDSGLAALSIGLPKLQTLVLRQCDEVCGTGAVAFRQLAEVELSSCRRVTDDSVAALAGCQHLTSLNLSGCQALSDAALLELAHLRGLRRLSLSGCQGLKCETLAALSALEELAALDVSLCRGISDATMAAMQALPISVLNASMCPQLTDAGLEVLAAHVPKRLRHVTVAGCEFVTRQGVSELEGALPGDSSQRKVEFNHQSPDLLSLLTRRDPL